MFIPLHDDNPLRNIRAPGVTYAIMAICTVIYAVFQSGFLVDANYASIAGFSVIPAELSHQADLREAYAVIPEPLTMITYIFLHGGWLHLVGNMLFLWVFGDNVEDALGHVRFLVFFLLCGIAGGLAYALTAWSSIVPLVGVSGAVAGVIAAYVLLYPKVKLWVLVFARIPLKISAAWVIGAWVVFQVTMILFARDHDTAWWAHLGGFFAGAALLPLLRRRADVLKPLAPR